MNLFLKTSLALLTTLLPTAAHASGEGSIRVVTTIPDLADITRIIGGDRVDVLAICKGREYIHSVRTKPSHLVALSKADMFVQMGLSMEHAWVPGLLEAARNRDIRPGKPGFVNVAVGWNAIQIPETLSRREAADIHPEGNPHFNIDARGGAHIANHVLDALVVLDPDGAEAHRAHHAAYLERIEIAAKRWTRIAKALEGKRAVTYHGDFDYLLESCGIETVARIEPKPGVPPTPRHLTEVIGLMRERKVEVILTSGWSNNKQVAEVARKTDAKVVVLPHMVGATKGATSWIAMMNELYDSLATAFGVEVSEE